MAYPELRLSKKQFTRLLCQEQCLLSACSYTNIVPLRPGGSFQLHASSLVYSKLVQALLSHRKEARGTLVYSRNSSCNSTRFYFYSGIVKLVHAFAGILRSTLSNDIYTLCIGNKRIQCSREMPSFRRVLPIPLKTAKLVCLLSLRFL